jgi:hypothetical protein
MGWPDIVHPDRGRSHTSLLPNTGHRLDSRSSMSPGGHSRTEMWKEELLDVDDVGIATSRSNNVHNVSAWLLQFSDRRSLIVGVTYDEVKAGMLHFKQKYFPPNIKSGQSIESACGIGLNLYMTLEIY